MTLWLCFFLYMYGLSVRRVDGAVFAIEEEISHGVYMCM